MATLLFSFETGSVPLSRIVDAVCLNFNYQVNLPDPANPGQTIPNPETKANFAKKQVANFVIDIVRLQEVNVARKTASDAITSIVLT